MSATRDKNQKVGFVYSNLYQLYKKGVEEAKNAPETASPAPGAPVGLTRGRVLKAQEAHAAADPAQITPFRPTELLGKRIEAAQALTQASLAQSAPLYVKTPQSVRIPENAAIQSLKQNLEKLNDLHSRLRFMLQELEDLVKE